MSGLILSMCFPVSSIILYKTFTVDTYRLSLIIMLLHYLGYFTVVKKKVQWCMDESPLHKISSLFSCGTHHSSDEVLTTKSRHQCWSKRQHAKPPTGRQPSNGSSLLSTCHTNRNGRVSDCKPSSVPSLRNSV